jgi:hypothetical protein
MQGEACELLLIIELILIVAGPCNAHSNPWNPLVFLFLTYFASNSASPLIRGSILNLHFKVVFHLPLSYLECAVHAERKSFETSLFSCSREWYAPVTVFLIRNPDTAHSFNCHIDSAPIIPRQCYGTDGDVTRPLKQHGNQA